MSILINKNKKYFVFYIMPGRKLIIKIFRIKKNRPVEIGIVKNHIKIGDFNKMSGIFRSSFPKIRTLQYLINKNEILPKHKVGRDYSIERI
jgi:hypothetical protein